MPLFVKFNFVHQINENQNVKTLEHILNLIQNEINESFGAVC